MVMVSFQKTIFKSIISCDQSNEEVAFTHMSAVLAYNICLKGLFLLKVNQ